MTELSQTSGAVRPVVKRSVLWGLRGIFNSGRFSGSAGDRDGFNARVLDAQSRKEPACRAAAIRGERGQADRRHQCARRTVYAGRALSALLACTRVDVPRSGFGLTRCLRAIGGTGSSVNVVSR